MQLERRFTTELHTAGRKLEGYAATFNNPARLDGFSEVIHPGAFRGSLAGRDVVALVDHDPTRLLARTRSKTLRLHEDAQGLAFSLDLPDTQTGRDVLALAERNDLGGMSFSFSVPPGGERWEGRRRELRAITLHEISVVSAWPAYAGTVVAARAKLPPRLARVRRYLETV